jgi:hypothetical protein
MEKRICGLNTAGKLRQFFEADQEFPEDLAWLVDAYESAAAKASWSARRTIQDPSDQTRERAVWYEAVCQTIERVLCTMTDADGNEMTLPER